MTTERLIIIVLSLLLVVTILIILYILRQKSSSYSEDVSPRGSVPRETHKKVLRDRDDYRDKVQDLEAKNYDLQEKYEGACLEKGNLERKIDELTRDNNEIRELLNKYSNTDISEVHLGRNNSSAAPNLKNETTQETLGEQTIKYASFPRSAGSTIYFSDLTDKLVEDSFFELKISGDTGKASFRPLDFMKIRNYDPAMAVILTEGVKPNIASTVVEVEMGEAYLDGNDWIINQLAKVKLS